MTSSILELKNIVKKYTLGGQDVFALNGVDFSLKKGEFVAVMGPSGSGKSTLLHIASFLDSPSSGEIFLKDTRVQDFSEKELARLRNKEIGFIFQQFNLLDRVSALENVGLPLLYAGVSKEERLQRSRDALEKVGLKDRMNNTRSQLSGGQQQRVAIARALVTDPSIIFADEPTGNLDSKSSADVMGFLTDLHKQGKTILMVTHEDDVASYAEKIIRMKDGKIVKG